MNIGFCLVSLVYFTTLEAASLKNGTTETDHGDQPKQGWTPEPEGRGTMSIIQSCALTMGLCSWSILCMNVPGTWDSKRLIIWRKAALTILGIMCPEILVSMAATQWMRARRSVQEFNLLVAERGPVDMQGRSPCMQHHPVNATQQMIEGQEHQRLENPQEPLSNDDNEREIFDMPMAFYADMGGFRLELRDGVSFPGNSRAIAWLVSQRLIKHRLFKPLMIEDKNKVDILLRLITLLQISYFLVTVIARCAQGLFITTAELTTASFIACSILAAFFWWHKPCDVLRPEPIKIDMSMEDLYKLTNPESTYRWEMTPLDWISREEWWWSKVWWNYVNILRGMGFSFGSDTKPIDRISDTYQGPLPRKEQYMLLVVTTGCFIIFFLAWNHDFPTRIELVFWRAVCTVLMSMLYVGLVISECIQAYPEMQQRSASWKWRSGSPSTTRWGNIPMPGCLSVLNSPKAKAITDRIDKVLEKIRNNSPNDDPSLRLPLKVILPMYFLGTVYWICRGYILIEDAIELRILPKSAYATVQWQNLWPHLG